MYTTWTDHITEVKEKEEFKKDIISSKRVLDRLKAVMEEDLETINHKEVNAKSYEIPNWDYKQAHVNGNKAYLYKYLKLIDLDQQKEFTSDR